MTIPAVPLKKRRELWWNRRVSGGGSCDYKHHQREARPVETTAPHAVDRRLAKFQSAVIATSRPFRPCIVSGLLDANTCAQPALSKRSRRLRDGGVDTLYALFGSGKIRYEPLNFIYTYV
jgi:hypothetical protein